MSTKIIINKLDHVKSFKFQIAVLYNIRRL